MLNESCFRMDLGHLSLLIPRGDFNKGESIPLIHPHISASMSLNHFWCIMQYSPCQTSLAARENQLIVERAAGDRGREGM